MRAALRRIVAVEAHRRRSGRCALVLHALGTGESFAIRQASDGFVDEASGLAVRAEPARLLIGPAGDAVAFSLEGDIAFAGYDPASRTRFTGRAGAGASITLYAGEDYWRFAVLDRESQPG
jgi:hypothetical protein